ncbi:MAG: hypothetical protein IPL79_19795 [Myxococcales bacterium]|nr:hypothetical protein [Myxococcales bacterium]
MLLGVYEVRAPLKIVPLWLLATLDVHEVYRPLGFAETEPGRFMAMRPSPTRWQAAPS